MVILAQPLPSLFFSLSIELASQGATELVGRNMELSNQFKFRFESGTAAVMGQHQEMCGLWRQGELIHFSSISNFNINRFECIFG